MKTKPFLLAAALVSLCSAQALTWQSFNGNNYALTEVLPWQDAQSAAVAEGGNLVTVDDAAEQAWLILAFGANEHLWIGFTDQVTEGTFLWISGEPVNYTNWNGGEPNNLNNEDFTVMNWGAAGSWNDLGPNSRARGIIEVAQAQGVPEAASTLALTGMAIAGLSLARRRLS